MFEVHIEQGHKHASKIVLRGEAGYSETGVEPGDVIFVLEQKQHKYLRRIHSDLVYEKVGTPFNTGRFKAPGGESCYIFFKR